MGIISGFALVFIIYEISKIVYVSKFLAILKKSRSLNKTKENDIQIDGQLLALFFVELAYIFYVVALLFTAYWYVGFFLALFAVLFYKSIDTKDLIVFDSILSISFLLLVIILWVIVKTRLFCKIKLYLNGGSKIWKKLSRSMLK